MGSTMVATLAAWQTVSELAERGMLDAQTSLHPFSDWGQLLTTHMLVQGPDPGGARKEMGRGRCPLESGHIFDHCSASSPASDRHGARDFQRSLELATTPEQQEVA